MKQILRLFPTVIVLIAISSGVPGRDGDHQRFNSTAPRFAQFDDPYSDFRNAHYSNAGLLSERDFFFFNDPATPEIYTLSLHDALPVSATVGGQPSRPRTL